MELLSVIRRWRYRQEFSIREIARRTGLSRNTSLEEKIDTSSAAGELVFHVFGAIAQFERRLIAERTRDGMNAARAKGHNSAMTKSASD